MNEVDVNQVDINQFDVNQVDVNRVDVNQVDVNQVDVKPNAPLLLAYSLSVANICQKSWDEREGKRVGCSYKSSIASRTAVFVLMCERE